ncbi:uncharacterized protein LOC132563968 [Ylistrum balloti]|uniref:uncharacterized protein LOC132563968 n=1 Tax=Ylistrum balloti TaxID=509963 RepID=UPI002905E970|nr:uncharacterized protein LOC132563968 [Ylistrum balloti]
MSSLYDPLGIVAPFVLQAKKIFQSESKMNKGWDDDMEARIKHSWLKWLQELPKLQELKVDRCILPMNFGCNVKLELHHFYDASQEAYRAVSFIRALNEDGEIHCAFVTGKSKLAPTKQMYIPRLELSAAVIAVKPSSILNEELNLDISRNVFRTESMIVLQYIKNKDKIFHTFVTNRIAIIHDGSTPGCWRYIDTKLNTADDAPRGLHVLEMVSRQRWLRGPEFLRDSEDDWPKSPTAYPNSLTDDKKVKATVQLYTAESESENELVNKLLAYHSSWYRLKGAIAWLLKYKDWVRKRTVSITLDSDYMIRSEKAIIAYVQRTDFGNEMEALKAHHGKVSKKSVLYNLEPVIDDDGFLHVGGRLLNAPISEEAKHPLILPKDHHISELIVRNIYEIETRHSGREYVLSVIRQKY